MRNFKILTSTGLGAYIGGLRGSNLLNSLVEISAFSTSNLLYKNHVKGEVTNKDIFFVMMMGGAIASATNIVKKAIDQGTKKIINQKQYFKGRALEGVSVTTAYSGDPKRILAHFLKVPGYKSKFGALNGGTSGSLTPTYKKSA